MSPFEIEQASRQQKKKKQDKPLKNEEPASSGIFKSDPEHGNPVVQCNPCDIGGQCRHGDGNEDIPEQETMNRGETRE
jgi:hypothetical protein